MKFRMASGRECLHFSCWSKKGYAVFAGLGREVKISRLALHMYGNVLLKAAENGVIVNTDREAEVVPVTASPEYLLESIVENKGEVRLPEKKDI